MLKYHPMDQQLLDEPDAHLLFQSVTEHYLAQAGGSFELVERLEAVPPEAKVVWRLWCFLAEVGGGGVRDYLWNHCLNLADLKEIHAALIVTKADQMRVLLENGICCSYEQGCGEFLEQPGAKEWASSFARALPVSDDELDDLSAQAAYPECSEVVAEYIRNNRLAL